MNRAHVSGSASEKTSDDTPAAHDVGGPSNCQSKLAHSLTWCLVWLLVPIVLAFGLTRSDIARLFYRRYMMFSYPALVLLTAGIGSFCKTRRSRFAYTVILLFALNALFGPWQQFMTDGRFVRHSHEDWRGAVAELNAHLESDAVQEDARLTQTRRLPVLIRAGLVEERLMETPADITASREYLLFPVSSIYRLHARGETLCVQTDPLDIQSHAMVSMLSITDSTRHELENAQGCWLIVRGVKWFDANSANLLTQLRNWFGVRANDEYQVVWEKRKDFGNVVVVRCQIDRRSIDRRSN